MRHNHYIVSVDFVDLDLHKLENMIVIYDGHNPEAALKAFNQAVGESGGSLNGPSRLGASREGDTGGE